MGDAGWGARCPAEDGVAVRGTSTGREAAVHKDIADVPRRSHRDDRSRGGTIPPPSTSRDSAFGPCVTVTSHGAPLPTGAQTAQEILSAQTPTICNLPARNAICGLAVLVITWNVISLVAFTSTALEHAMCGSSLLVYVVGLLAAFRTEPKFAKVFYLLVAAELLVILGADTYKVLQVHRALHEEPDDENRPNLTAAVLSLIVNLILHSSCLFCARRFHRIRVFDVDYFPEMEATMDVPPEMNRIGMQSRFDHDTGIPAHDAHFRVTGLRSS